jgi:hypothetical protein
LLSIQFIFRNFPQESIVYGLPQTTFNQSIFVNMKKFYPFATLLLSIIALNDAQAQTYSGGTYTAVRNRDWHVASGVNAWDASGEPPANCVSCLIKINSGVTVTLNTSVTLAGGSLLQVGTDGSAATALVVTSSSGSNFASSHNLLLLNDGSNPNNRVEVNTNIDMVNASNAANYDGVFTVYTSGSSTTAFKKLGLAPAGYVNEVAVDQGTPAQQLLTGTITLASIGTLPVILSEFTAVLNSNKVDLAWTTQVEINSDHFTVQRSVDGGNKWQDLGTVAAHGNYSGTSNYSFTDANPASGVAQYRLLIVDLDKKSEYSTIKIVRSGLITGVSVFPNPAHDYVNVSVAGTENNTLSIRLLNQAGQLLAEKKVSNAGGSTVSLPVSTYPTGNYLIVVKGSDGTQQVTKLVVAK